MNVTESSATRPETVTAAASFRDALSQLIRARHPLVQIVTFEEDRALREIHRTAKTLGKKVLLWSASQGLFGEETEKKAPHFVPTDMVAALEQFEKKARSNEPHIFVLLDPMPYLTGRSTDPIYRRRLRDLATNIRTKGYHSNCILLSPSMEIPLELEKEVTVLDFPLPDRSEVAAFVRQFFTKLKDAPGIKVSNHGLQDALVNAALGLTMVEIEGALASAVVDDLILDHDDVARVFKQKQQIIRKSGILEFCDTRGLSLDSIGGLDVLKKWLEIREAAFSEAGRDFGIQNPKGALITGVPGCGKSLSARCVAASWNLPLVRLDMGKIYSSLVGSSEEHMREAIRACEAISPCVLWIDEIEKGLPRPGRYVGDSGVSLRVFGTFLTWLQEKTSAVFVFATANETNLLPPEILRKGRFDEVFFVDLPTDNERRQIIDIHLRKVERDPEQFDMDKLVSLSGADQFGSDIVMSGAEIEAWVNESLIHAFYRNQADLKTQTDLAMEDLSNVVNRIVPLAQLRQEEIATMRSWANQHAIGASSGQGESESTTLSVGGRHLDL
ncbi:MAG: AAA family ATPase [Alphaproteobacteria bacterium]|nr:AAA family ATPase [Alphaproteobacteria bacterium]